MMLPLPREVIAQAASVHRVGIKDVLDTNSRQRHIVMARHRAIRELVKAYPGMRWIWYARQFGCDHTTILYALNRVHVEKRRWAA